MGRNVTTDIFIREAKERHGDRYDYSKSVYKTAKDKLEIICRLHGSFYQPAYEHSKGRNCPECSKVQRGETECFNLNVKDKIFETILAIEKELT